MWSLALPILLACIQDTARPSRVTSPPVRPWPTAIALIVFEYSSGKEQDAAIEAWRAALDKEGIATWVVRDAWEHGEDVRDVLRALRHAEPPIEGAFLLDDVPTFALHGAEHLGSAPRGSPPNAWEAEEDIANASIGTDIPYADLDLKLESVPDPLKGHSRHSLGEHVRLAVDSPQRVEKDLYVGRWSPDARSSDEDPGDGLREKCILEFLARSTEAHLRPRELNRITAFADARWNFSALEGESAMLSEVFAAASGRARRISVEQATKLRNPGHRALQLISSRACDLFLALDATVDDGSRPIGSEDLFHWNDLGAPIGGSPIVWAPMWRARPGADFGSCAASLVSAPSGTVACLIGSDRVWNAGLLAIGEPIGRAHLDEPRIDSHIIGDPTLSYRRAVLSPTRVDPFRDSSTTIDVLESMIAPESPLPYRLGAIRELARRRGAEEVGRLATLAKSDASPSMRLQALECLARSRATALDDVLPVTLRDRSEGMRVASAMLMGEIGRADYLRMLFEHAEDDPSVRVEQAVVDAMARYPESMLADLDPAFVRPADPKPADRTTSLTDPFLGGVGIGLSAVNVPLHASHAALATLEAADAGPKEKRAALSTLRQLRPHRAIGIVLDIARDPKAPVELRKGCITTLASYPYSPGRPQVTEALRKLADDAGTSAGLRDEARRTIRRLDDGPNSPLDP